MLKDFLLQVITPVETGLTTPKYFCLATMSKSGVTWHEEWFEWPRDIDRIVEKADKLKNDFNVYFSTYLFSKTHSQKSYVLPTHTIQADLDDADLTTLPIPPTVLVETSPNRHQGYWILTEPTNLDVHEILSRKITYSTTNIDHSGWPLGRKVRVPDTLNHKYMDGPKPIRVIGGSNKRVDPAKIEMILTGNEYIRSSEEELSEDEKFLINPLGTIMPTGPLELLESIRSKLPIRVATAYELRTNDRSAALWALECACFRAGLDRHQVFFLAKHSAHNKFEDLQAGANRELAKDVLRAEGVVRSKVLDTRALVLEARRNPGSAIERKMQVLSLVQALMRASGEFIHTANTCWYVRHDLGRPISITSHSEQLEALLDIQFGLNASENDQSYIVHGLLSRGLNMLVNGKVGALSSFDTDSNTLYLHTGKQGVLKITKDSIATVTNGADGVIFPWTGSDMFYPNLQSTADWGEILFGNCLDNTVRIPKASAMALLKVWTLFILLRDAAVSRPILALFGQPGCVAGNTPITIRRGTNARTGRSMPISRLYKQFHGTYAAPGHRHIATEVLSEKDGVIKYRKIKDVSFSGQKYTFTVKVDGCIPFRVTEDHRFLTPSGYKALKDISVGDYVVTKGNNLGRAGKRSLYRPVVSAKYHPRSHGREQSGALYGTIYQSHATVEAAMNNLTVEDYLKIMNTDKVSSLRLLVIPVGCIVHHKDNNHTNDTLENLEVLTKQEHDKLHGSTNARNFGKFSGLYGTEISVIVSIEPANQEPTYDIQMEDEDAPNFVVNGVIVHNSGKSTLFRRVYALLYGRGKSLNSVTRPDDFDQAVSSDPLVVLDNVDTWEAWLPDRLALSAGSSSIVRRKLYTDSDSVIIERQAIVGITAHSPKFGREDVADRLLLLNFERLKSFTSEAGLLETIFSQRNNLWGAIIHDIQTILSTPLPRIKDVPQFRVEDFAYIGVWIARAIGMEHDFVASLQLVKTEQTGFSLAEDMILVQAMMDLADRTNGTGKDRWYNAAELWLSLEATSQDVTVFQRLYKNSVSLNKKIWALFQSLKDVVDIEWEYDTKTNARKWKIAKKV